MPPPTACTLGNEHLYTERRTDSETGLQLNRYRFYHQQLGRWVTRDPAGYANGYNLYAAYFVPNGLDPLGLETLQEHCERKKKLYEERRVPEIKQLKGCKFSSIVVVCKECEDEMVDQGILGQTQCNDRLRGPKMAIVICLNSLKNRYQDEDEAKRQLDITLIHEDQHVADYCSCDRKCSYVQKVPGDDTATHCQRVFCFEIRAHSADGSCDHRKSDAARRKCIEEKIWTMYSPTYKDCKKSHLAFAMQKCYVPKGEKPVFPPPYN